MRRNKHRHLSSVSNHTYVALVVFSRSHTHAHPHALARSLALSARVRDCFFSLGLYNIIL